GRPRLHGRRAGRHRLRDVGLRTGAYFGHVPLLRKRQLRVRHRRPQRRHAEVDRPGQNMGQDDLRQPGLPRQRGDSAPMVIDPSGKIDVLYQGYHITDTRTYAMEPAFSYYTSSTDQGKTWSTPIAVGPEGGTMSLD